MGLVCKFRSFTLLAVIEAANTYGSIQCHLNMQFQVCATVVLMLCFKKKKEVKLVS